MLYIGASSLPYKRLLQHAKVKNVEKFEVIAHTKDFHQAKRLEESYIKNTKGLSNLISQSTGLKKDKPWYYIYKLTHSPVNPK